MGYLEKAVEISTSSENCESDNWGDWVSLCGEADREITQLQAEVEIQKSHRSIAENKRIQFQLKALEFQGRQAATVGNLCTALDKLKWIPVSEGLPKKPFKVHVCNTSVCFTGEDSYVNGKWLSGRDYTHYKPVTLPEEEK